MQDIEKRILIELRDGLGSIRGYLDHEVTQNIFAELLFIKLLSNQINIENQYFSDRIFIGLNFEEYIECSKEFFYGLEEFLNKNTKLKDIVIESNKLQKIDGNEVLKKILIAFSKMTEINKGKPAVVFKCFLDLRASENTFSISSEPPSIRKLINKLLEGKKIKTIYDPAIGTGMLATSVANNYENRFVYGQDMNSQMVRICKMLLILEERMDEIENIKEGNTIINPKHTFDYKLKTFDCIVSNPPTRIVDWGYEEIKKGDKFNRFYRGLPQRSIGEFAFITHVVESLNEKGIGIMIESIGVLFRGSREGVIRKALIEENLIETIIVLPTNMLYGIRNPITLLIFNKKKYGNEISFIDASRIIEPNKRLTVIEDEIIEKIVRIYKEKIEIEGISRNVSKLEIEENNFNLNIQRYIKERVEEEKLDIDKINREIYELEIDLIEIQKSLKKYFN